MKIIGYKPFAALCSFVLFTLFLSPVLYGYSGGISGRTLKPGSEAGCNCHSSSAQQSVTVSINGPATVLPNSINTYTVTISGGPLTRGGTNIAASAGTLGIVTSDLQVMDAELTHTSPKAPVSGTVSFQFRYTAPAALGNQTLYANGNSVNFNGGADGSDLWNFAPNKTVTVASVVPVEMTAFTGTVSGNNIQLNWTTATELNNKGFELERMNSRDMKWQQVAFVAGKGNSSVQNSYSYIDKNLPAGSFSYRVKQIDVDGSFQYHNMTGEINIGTPAEFILSQNYPNPFNPSTSINYSLPSEGNVSLKLYDLSGAEAAVLLNEYKSAGNYSFNYSAKGLSSGVYYYKLNVTGGNGGVLFSQSKKLVLLK